MSTLHPIPERAIPIARSDELAGVSECAFWIPFLPFPIEPFRADRSVDAHESNNGASECAAKEFPKSEKEFPRVK